MQSGIKTTALYSNRQLSFAHVQLCRNDLQLPAAE